MARARMRRLGMRAYRFSTSWSRVLPHGHGLVNPAGLGFYDRLVDTLLESGIEPLVTLYHWGLPAALDDRGGWLNPDSPKWFADYAALMFRQLDDRVTLWATLNEPWVVTDGGYLHGRSRARSSKPLRSADCDTPAAACTWRRSASLSGIRPTSIGLVVNLEPKYPASNEPADREATARADAYMNRQYLDPVFLGRYPGELGETFGEAWPAWPAEDFQLINQPIDFLGVNLLHTERHAL
jgi:beta-glucosidase